MNVSNLIHGLLKANISKFIFAGVVNTIFGYSVYAFFLYVGLPYGFSLALATVMGVIFNYFNFGRVFLGKNEFQIRWNIFFKFILGYGLMYVFNLLLLEVLVGKLNLNPYIGQLISMPIMIFLSWIIMNYWVYLRDKNDG